MAFDGVTRLFTQSRAQTKRQTGEDDAVTTLLLDIRDAAGPVPLGDAVYAVVGSGETVITSPPGAVSTHFRVEAAAFLFRIGDQSVRTVNQFEVAGSDVTVSGHGYSQVDGPVQVFSSGSLPAPLLSGQLWFIGSAGADAVRLYSSRAAALAGTDPQVFTTSGAGTLTMGKAIAAPGATDITVGDNAITVAATSEVSKEYASLTRSSQAVQSYTVKGSTAGARLLFWFSG